MTSLVVVSPHLDDAVLSCGGAVVRAARRGERVVVVTVFSEGEGHRLRRAEDISALASLGAEALHLGLLDAPERLGLARSHRALVEEATVQDDDVAIVRAALDAALSNGGRVMGPLGVGGHIDHRVVHEALRGRRDVAFYEEQPYAFLAGATRARLLELGLPDLDGAPERATVIAQLERLPHLRAYLADDDGGARARAWLLSKLCIPGRASLVPVRAEVLPRDAETAAAVLRAILLYASQIEALFGGLAGVAAARAERTVTLLGSAPACALR